MAKNNKVTPPPSVMVTPADLKRMQGIATMGGTQVLKSTDAEAISLAAMMHGADLNKKATSNELRYVPGLDYDYYNNENMFSLDRLRSVEDIMHDNQSGAEVFGAFFGRTLNKALTEVLKIPAYLTGLGAATAGQIIDGITREDNHDFMKIAFDNPAVNMLNKVNESINEKMPVFHSDDYRNGSFLDQVTDGTFWATEGADGIGFLLSAYGPGLLVKSMNLGSAIVRTAANTAAGYNRVRAMDNIRRATTAINRSRLANGASGAVRMERSIDNAAITLFNTTFEAGTEANHAAQSLDKEKDKIIENHIKGDLARASSELEQGLITFDQFKERVDGIKAKGEAFYNSQRSALMQSVFLANAAILVLPNAIQTNTLLNPSGKFLSKPKISPNFFKSAGKGLAKGIAMEGFFEEGLQSVVENIYSDKAKKGQLVESGFLSLFDNTNIVELIEGYGNMITSIDGQKAVFLGSVLGGVMNSVGQYRSDKSDFETTTKIHRMAGDVQKLIGTLDSLYKHDKDGNVVFDDKKNPIVDIKKLADRALDHLSQEQMANIIEYAESLDNKALAEYAKSLIAKDVATSFALAGEAGRTALLTYVEQHEEVIKNNESLTEEQKEEALKDLNESKKLLLNHYTNTLADIQAYDLYKNTIIPSKEDVKLTDDAVYENFKQEHFAKYLQNRAISRTIGENIDLQLKETNDIFKALSGSDTNKIASISKIDNVFDKLKAYEELDILKPKIEDIRALIKEKERLDNEYRDSINNPDKLLSDLKAMMGQYTNENYKAINRAEYEPIYQKIINAKSESELNSITLPKELRELFKDEFVVAKAKRKAEIAKEREERKKNTATINENIPDTDPEVVMSEVVGSNSIVIDHDTTVEYELREGEAVVGEPIPVDIETLEDGSERYVITVDGYIIDTMQEPDEIVTTNNPVIETAQERHNRLLEEQANNAVTTNQNTKADEEVSETPSEVATQNVANNTQTEIPFNSEQQPGVNVKQENKKPAVKDDENIIPPVNLPAHETSSETKDEVPSETLDDYHENESYNEHTETETGKAGNVVIAKDNNVTSKSITLRNPRAISYDTKGLNPALTGYVTNSNNKANDEFKVVISPVRSGSEHKFTVEAREVLERIRKTGKYTINDYMTLLYKLPLTVVINGNIKAPLDNITDRQIIEDPSAPGGIRLKENSSYNILTAIPMRMQIINSLLSDPDAEIKLTFHKQLPGFLNTNRTINDKGIVVSVQSPVTTLKLPSRAKDPVTYFVQNLAYVNHAGEVLGLSDNLRYTDDARTPGIIYLRVPNLNGKMHNVQLSRKRIDNSQHDVPGYEGITKQGALAKIIYDAIFNFGNPNDKFLSDFLVENEDNLRIINQLFPEALSIINKYHGSSATVADFINFFIHMSSNDVTRLQFKDGTLFLGSLAREKTVLGSLMPEGHNYISFKHLFEEGFVEERAAIFYEGFSQYIDLIKHNVIKEYADVNSEHHREYVEYLMNNVLTSDIKPGVDIFSNNVNTFVRTENGQYIVRDLRMDTDIYFEHKLPNTEPGSSVFSYEEVYNNIDPLVRPFIHLSGLFDMNPAQVAGTPTKVSDSVNEQVEKEVESAKVKKVEKPISTDAGVVVNTADTSIEDSVNPQLTIDFNQQLTTPTTPLQPSAVQLLASKSFTIGRTKYSVREMSDGSITIVRRTNKGSVLLKKGSKTYQKVFALYNPEEALRQQIEKSIKRPSLQEAVDIISDLVTTNPDYLVLLYLAQGGTVSGKGFRHRKEKGLAWYEGRGKNKAPDSMVSDVVADHIFADYTATANYDAVAVRDSLEEAMLRISSRAEAKQRLIDAAHELLNQEALAQLHYLNEEEIRNHLQASERESVVEVYDNAERDANLESDEDIINSYYDSMLADLQALPIEEQIAIYEQWERESQEAQTNTSQTTTDDIEQQSTTESNTLVEVKEGVLELFNENPELANEVYEALGFDINALSFAERAKKYKEFGITKSDGTEITEQDIEQNPTFYQNNTNQSTEEYIASEKTIRDLAARMSDRIGIPVRYISDRSQKFRGKLENGTAVINLAYATLDTPIHEILGHPIIRAIKNSQNANLYKEYDRSVNGWFVYGIEKEPIWVASEKEADALINSVPIKNINSQLYQNLLKELEYGRGKEILDRVKRDYQYKNNVEKTDSEFGSYKIKTSKHGTKYFDTYEEAIAALDKYGIKYTLEEQQEEALVELLGLYTADRLDKVKDGKLISLLKRLLKEMKQFVRSLINQKEVEIAKLPDNMTLGDIADLLAYSNSKLILPGNEVVYTTPDNQTFKTYQEASNHISELAKSVEDVDLSDVSVNTSMPNSFEVEVYMGEEEPPNILKITKENGQWYISDNWTGKSKIEESDAIKYYQDTTGNYFGAKQNNISSFIERNKQYEQAKEIIEEWKKVNNIQYNPEEVYSRGQEFVSVVGAYSDFDVNLMMQNLLQHIEDNQKAGGEFTISAFTKPVNKQIGHLEGGGGKIKFKIYPQSQDIKWASNIDVYSGSVWDASEKVNKDKKSELLGISYTKYPALHSIDSVQPNLANIIDNLAHHHNELGISLTGSNFRLEYDADIPYTTKKIIDSINSILDQKYGKLIKPEINEPKVDKYVIKTSEYFEGEIIEETYEFNTLKEAEAFVESRKIYNAEHQLKIEKYKGIQPTQTNETLKESIDSVKSKYPSDTRLTENAVTDIKTVPLEFTSETTGGSYAIIRFENNSWRAIREEGDTRELSEAQVLTAYNKSLGNTYTKNFTEQALINTKIAKLKEVAKKYPRSLIRSEIKSYKSTNQKQDLFDIDELPFQLVGDTNLTPKQQLEERLKKQLAQQLYSQYLKQNPNGTAEGFKDFVKNKTNEQQTINNTENEQTETQTIRGDEQGAASEVYSSPESQEDLYGTHEAPESIESIETELNAININYDNMSNREQMRIVKELAIENGMIVEPSTLRDATSRRELLNELIEGAKNANELTLLKNKICSIN